MGIDALHHLVVVVKTELTLRLFPRIETVEVPHLLIAAEEGVGHCPLVCPFGHTHHHVRIGRAHFLTHNEDVTHAQRVSLAQGVEPQVFTHGCHRQKDITTVVQHRQSLMIVVSHSMLQDETGVTPVFGNGRGCHLLHVNPHRVEVVRIYSSKVPHLIFLPCPLRILAASEIRVARQPQRQGLHGHKRNHIGETHVLHIRHLHQCRAQVLAGAAILHMVVLSIEQPFLVEAIIGVEHMTILPSDD